MKTEGCQESPNLLTRALLQASFLETPLSTSSMALLILVISDSFGLCFDPFMCESLSFLGIELGHVVREVVLQMRPRQL